MGKRGPQRKENQPRDASGRINHYQAKKVRDEVVRDDARSVARWARLRDIMSHLIRDPRLGTLMGKMMILQSPLAITPAQFEAGCRLAQRLEEYDVQVLGVRRSVAAQDVNKAGGKSLSAGISSEEAKAITNRMMECEGALAQRCADRGASCKALVQGSGSIPSFSDAVAGLDELAKLWALDKLPPDRIRREGDKLFVTIENRIRQFAIQRDDPRQGAP